MWKAQSLQAVWFTPVLPSTTAMKLFGLISPEDPTSTNSNTLPTGGKISSASGPFRDLGVTITIQPGRIDLILLPAISLNPQMIMLSDGPPLIDDYKGAVDALAEIFAAIADLSPNRLAVIFNLAIPTETPEEATRIASDLSHMPLGFDDASDLFLRVNRRGKLKGAKGDVLCNRLMVWKQENYQGFNILTDQGIPASNGIVQAYAAGLQLDVNTLPLTGAVFDKEDADTILQSLLNEAVRLAEDATIVALR